MVTILDSFENCIHQQGKDFEKVFELKKDLSRLTDNRKAMVVFIIIQQLFAMDANFQIETLLGRINLYCLLLIHCYGKTLLEEQLKRAQQLQEERKDFAYHNCLNLILPDNIPELNLRLRFLWGATTQIHTTAMEGGKRQTCAVWNDIDRYPTSQPMNSFYSQDEEEVFEHRPTPNDQDMTPYIAKFRTVENLFYSRTGLKMPTNLYACNDKAPYFTIELVKKIKQQSSIEAANNAQIQVKYLNDFLAEVLENMCHESIITTVIIPTLEEKRKGLKVFEATPPLHVANLSRYFIEVFATLASDRRKYEKLNNAFHDWVVAAKTELKKVYDGTDKEYFPLWRAGDGKGKVKEAEEKRTNADWFVNHGLALRKERFYYSVRGFDPLLEFSCVNLPETQTIEWCNNPKKIDFFWAYRVLNNPDTSKQKVNNLTFTDTWKNFEFTLLQTVIGFSVYDKKSLESFKSLLLNNGRKEILEYGNDFIHEVDGADPKNINVSPHNQRQETFFIGYNF